MGRTGSSRRIVKPTRMTLAVKISKRDENDIFQYGCRLLPNGKRNRANDCRRWREPDGMG